MKTLAVKCGPESVARRVKKLERAGWELESVERAKGPMRGTFVYLHLSKQEPACSSKPSRPARGSAFR